MDPRDTPDATLDVDAAFVEPSSANQLGLNVEITDLVKNSEQILIVSPGETEDLSSYQEIIDGVKRWKITGVTVLKPGPVIVLAFVGVKQ